MIIDIAAFKKYLTPVKEGLGIKDDCPNDTREQIKLINKEYFEEYGEDLIIIKKRFT